MVYAATGDMNFEIRHKLQTATGCSILGYVTADPYVSTGLIAETMQCL
jgi:hypothetical protein